MTFRVEALARYISRPCLLFISTAHTCIHINIYMHGQCLLLRCWPYNRHGVKRETRDERPDASVLLLTITRCRRRCHLSLLLQMVGVIDASTYEGIATTLFGHSQSVRTLVWSLQSKGEGHKIPWDEFIAFAEKDDHIPTSAEDWEKFVEVLAMLDVEVQPAPTPAPVLHAAPLVVAAGARGGTTVVLGE